MFVHQEEIYNTRSAEIVVPIILDLFKINSVLDVGCGLGTWLKVFLDHGVENIQGIDGSYVDLKRLFIDQEHFLPLDLTKHFQFDKNYDLVISLEVAEHLPFSSADQFVACLCKSSDLVIFSAAIPGQGGQMHVNEQWPDYWKEKFLRHGYIQYDLIRPAIWEDSNIDVWYRQNMFVYAKKEYLELFNTKKIEGYIHPELWLKRSIQYRDIQSQHNDILSGRISIFRAMRIFIRTLYRLLLNK